MLFHPVVIFFVKTTFEFCGKGEVGAQAIVYQLVL